VTSYNSPTGRDPEENTVNQVEYVYDGWGDVATEYQEHDGAVATATTPKVQYVYDDVPGDDGTAGAHRLAEIIYPSGRAVQYGYEGTDGAVDNVMSRLATIGDTGDIYGAYAAYKYLGLGTVIEEDYVQAHVKLSYLDSSGNLTGLDNFGRVRDQVWEHYHLDEPWYEIVDGTVDDYHYTYDPAGNRTGRENVLNENLSETYQYDVLNRLTYCSVGGGTAKIWSYDSLGNDISRGNYSAANEETPNQGSSGYDAAGNMTTLRSGETAKYDAWNRLAEVDGSVDIPPTSFTTRYEYDGTGRRIYTSVDYECYLTGTEEADYYDGQKVIEHHEDLYLNDGPFLGKLYIWSPRYIDAPILRDTYMGRDGLDTAARVYYLGDANYNVTGLVKYDSGSSQWKVAERYSYTPYGVVTYRNDDWTTATSSGNNNTVLYTGRTLDSATGLYYYRARYYDAALERFINRDPIGYRGGMDLYLYVSDNPTNDSDPTGLVRHHWFMMYWRNRSGQAKVDAICLNPKIDINRYTTEYSGAEHAFINRWVTGDLSYALYQNMYERLLSSSKDCCQFLIGMKGLMLAWHSAIRFAQSQGTLYGQVSPFDLIHYDPKISGDPPTSNSTEFDQKLVQACGCSEEQKDYTNKQILNKRTEMLNKIKHDLQLVDPGILEQILDSLNHPVLIPIPAGMPATRPLLPTPVPTLK
jgi:RHS repeat-associated protein